MTEHKMVTIDGIRYRPEDAAEAQKRRRGERKAGPITTSTVKGGRKGRPAKQGGEGTNDADSGGDAGRS